MAASKWVFSSGYISKVRPDVAGPIIEDLANRDCLTAENLVEVSRPVDAPLHPAFEWDDTVAAELYRRYQANNLIHSIRIISEGQKEPQRFVVHIERGDPKYRTIDTVLSDQEMTDKMLKMAYQELCAFQKKYRHLSELANVIHAIDELEQMKMPI